MNELVHSPENQPPNGGGGHKAVTVTQTLARGMLQLAKSSMTPRSDAQILLAYALGREREWLLSHGESYLSRAQGERYAALCDKRAAGMPIAYITGFAGFYGREFAVNEHVLVPRPETEHLVDEAIAHLRAKIDPDSQVRRLFTVFEAGVGSGAIACSIAAELPGVVVDGSDVSLSAIKVAEYNARRLNVHMRCKFYFADVVKNDDKKNYDLVVANLPYIPTGDVPRKPDPVAFEPRVALDGGPDGLVQYRKLLEAAPRLLRPGAVLLMEAAPMTAQPLHALAQEAFPQDEVSVGRDYAGLERYVRVKRAPVSSTGI